MRKMLLFIVFTDKVNMDVRNFFPACCLVIPVICQTTINVKQGFGVIFPTLPFVDFDFADTKLLVNLPSQIRQKYASTVADDRLGNPEMRESLVDYVSSKSALFETSEQ